jgi:hypothetical protein
MSVPLSPEKEAFFKAFREAPLPDVAALASSERVKRIETYHDMRLHGIFLSIDETRHAISLISADRAEQARRKAADTRAVKKAEKSGAYTGPAPSINDLI